MGIFIYLAIQIGIFAIQYWLLPALQKHENPKYANLSDIQLPRAERGAPVPIFFGRVLFRGGNVDWVGTLAHGEIREEDQVIGYYYDLPFRMVLGIPCGNFAAMNAIYYGDQLMFTGKHGTTNLDVAGFVNSAGKFQTWGGYWYGGSQTEWPGADDGSRAVSDRWTYWYDEILPRSGADPDTFSPLIGAAWFAFFVFATDPNVNPTQQYGGWSLGDSPQPPAYNIETTAGCDGTLSASIHPIGAGDANPMAVAYALLTEPFGKGGLDPALIDKASFITAATTLAAEKHGCSGIIYTGEYLGKVLQKIYEQVDAVPYQDPVTGLYTVKLVRDDYDPATLPSFSDAAGNVISVDTFAVQGWSETYNEVIVSYTNRAIGYKPDSASDQDMANFYMQGKPKSTTVTMPYVATADLAQLIATRELRAVSRPLRRIKVTVTRDGYTLRPGGLFKFSWSERGLVNVIFRIGRVDFGQLFDGRIVVEALEDVFAVDKAVFQVPVLPPPPPPSLATPHVYDVFEEAPRWLQLLAADMGRIKSVDNQYLWYLAVPNENDVTNAGQFSPDGGVTWYGDSGRWGYPTTAKVTGYTYTRLSEPYDTILGLKVGSVLGKAPQDVSTFGAYTVSDVISILGTGMLRVGREIMAYETVTDHGDGTYTLNNVWRGLLDTVPVDHPIDDIVYFLSPPNFIGLVGFNVNQIGTVPMAISLPLLGRVLPWDLFAPLSPDTDEKVDSLTVVGRTHLPYPAADLVVNGTKGAIAKYDDSNDVQWRERLGTSDIIVRGDQVAETTTYTYDVNAKKKGFAALPRVNIVSAVASGAGTPNVHAVGLAKAGHGTIGVSVRTKNGSLASWQDPEIDAELPHWRNLCINGDFSDGLTGWSTVAGSPTTDTVNALGSFGHYLKTTSASGNTTIERTFDIAGYQPADQSLLLSWYDVISGTGDSTIMTLLAYDSSGTHLGSDATSTVTGATTAWGRHELTYANLPAGTAKVKLQVTLHPNSSGVPSSHITRIELRCGQFSSQLLTNPSFESGVTGWTMVNGSFWVSEANELYEGTNRLRCSGIGGGTPILRQDNALPAGYEFGTVVMDCARGQTTSGGSGSDQKGSVTIIALDGGGSVIGSATTFLESIVVGAGKFVERTLAYDLPALTATVRLELSVDSGTNHSAMFDDVRVRIFKHLDPDAQIDMVFDAPSVQPLPTDAGQWEGNAQLTGITPPSWVHAFTGAKPTYDPFNADMVATGSHLAFDAKFVGLYGADGSTSTSSLEFPSGTLGSEYLRTLSDTTLFDFSTTGDFAVLVVLRLYGEWNYSGTLGVCGRRSSTPVGWEITIDGVTGHPTATLYGASATKTVSASIDLRDGAPHAVLMSYDSIGHVLHMVDEFGNDNTVSTVGMGEIEIAGQLFMIGAGFAGQTTLKGQIARMYVWNDHTISAANMATFWTHGRDPNGLINSHTRSTPWALPMPSDADGAAFSRSSAAQVTLGWDTTRWALPCQDTAASKTPTMDLKNATYWTAGANASLTFDQVGPEGWMDSVQIHHASGVTNDYFELSGVALGAGNPTMTWCFRSPGGAAVNISVELYNSSGVLKDTVTFSTGARTTWQTISRVFSWDNSTATAKFRFYATSGTTVADIILAPLIGIYQLGANVVTPLGVPTGAVNGTTSNAQASYTITTSTPTIQGNSEGELLVTARLTDTSRIAGTFATIRNNVSANDKRKLRIGSTGATAIMLSHYDGTGTLAEAGGTVADYLFAYVTERGRWARIGLLGDHSHFATLVTDGGSTVSVRGSTWTPSTTAPNRIDIGSDNGSDKITGWIAELRYTVREMNLQTYPYPDVGPPGWGGGPNGDLLA